MIQLETAAGAAIRNFHGAVGKLCLEKTEGEREGGREGGGELRGERESERERLSYMYCGFYLQASMCLDAAFFP